MREYFISPRDEQFSLPDKVDYASEFKRIRSLAAATCNALKKRCVRPGASVASFPPLKSAPNGVVILSEIIRVVILSEVWPVERPSEAKNLRLLFMRVLRKRTLYRFQDYWDGKIGVRKNLSPTPIRK